MESSKSNYFHNAILANRYKIISKLDSGASSQVFKVLDEKTEENKVAKIFDDNERTLFSKETKIYEIINRLNLPTNIKFYESSIDDLLINDNIRRKMYVILEYGSKGNLFDALYKTKNGFTEDVCKYILLNILNAVDALHKESICHRDLKLENIVLVGDNYDIKLIDFGLSEKFIDENNQKINLNLCCGTRPYQAPEMKERKPYDGTKVDIFSIGVMLFLLMTKKFGFAEAKVKKDIVNVKQLLYKLIKEKKYDKYWELMAKYYKINNLSPKFKNLFLKMVAYNPDERPTIEEIRKDEFLADIANASEEYIDLLREKMINEIENVEM